MGLTDAARKTTGTDPRVLPRTVIYYPELTCTLPMDLSAASGLNAMAHCVEAFEALLHGARTAGARVSQRGRHSGRERAGQRLSPGCAASGPAAREASGVEWFPVSRQRCRTAGSVAQISVQIGQGFVEQQRISGGPRGGPPLRVPPGTLDCGPGCG
ncbi:iron-containing alcohol dehydrogenase [Amycolatopsis sp. NPDC051373]|uniref:iron-containing alcohol dehydrogenase n=1 Tax=Amycolatopsis sp. NPDC051373 TaxID=3155801 RepID=UPI00344F4C5F